MCSCRRSYTAANHFPSLSCSLTISSTSDRNDLSREITFESSRHKPWKFLFLTAGPNESAKRMMVWYICDVLSEIGVGPRRCTQSITPINNPYKKPLQYCTNFTSLLTAVLFEDIFQTRVAKCEEANLTFTATQVHSLFPSTQWQQENAILQCTVLHMHLYSLCELFKSYFSFHSFILRLSSIGSHEEECHGVRCRDLPNLNPWRCVL